LWLIYFDMGQTRDFFLKTRVARRRQPFMDGGNNSESKLSLYT
jgi:hypothetical protein